MWCDDLKAQMKAKRVTYKQLAEQLGSSKTEIFAWVSGRGLPGSVFRAKLAELGYAVDFPRGGWSRHGYLQLYRTEICRRYGGTVADAIFSSKRVPDVYRAELCQLARCYDEELDEYPLDAEEDPTEEWGPAGDWTLVQQRYRESRWGAECGSDDAFEPYIETLWWLVSPCEEAMERCSRELGRTLRWRPRYCFCADRGILGATQATRRELANKFNVSLSRIGYLIDEAESWLERGFARYTAKRQITRDDVCLLCERGEDFSRIQNVIDMIQGGEGVRSESLCFLWKMESRYPWLRDWIRKHRLAAMYL